MPDASTQRGPDTRVRRGVAVALVLVALTVAHEPIVTWS